MINFPKSVLIKEEGPREGFQIGKGTIATQRKIELIDALSKTGLKHIQIVSFVNPRAVPGMADAEDVVGHPLPGSVMKGGSLRRPREKLSVAAKGDRKFSEAGCRSSAFDSTIARTGTPNDDDSSA